MAARSIKRIAVVLAVLGVGFTAVALGQSPEEPPVDRRVLEESCRSYAELPASTAAEACAEVLRSGGLSAVEYGPESGGR